MKIAGLMLYKLYKQLGCQVEPGFVSRQDQLNMGSSRGRGRGRGAGKGGRGGRGGRVGRGGRGESEKKRKHESTQPEYTNEEWDLYVAENWDEWWYQETGDDGSNWPSDMSQPRRAFDRYAHLDSKHSLNQLMDKGNDSSKKAPKTKEKDLGLKDECEKPATDKAEKDESAARKKAKAKDSHEKKPAKQKAPKVQDDGGEETTKVPVPKEARQQVAEITKYVKEMQALELGVEAQTDLTNEKKAKLREGCPNSEEGRLGCYWKNPSVGVFVRSEKREICNIVVPDSELPYFEKLAACLKAASMLAA